MTARLLGLLAALVSVLALARAADDWRLGVALAGLAAILAALGPRWELDRGRQLVTCAMGAAAGYAVVALLYERHPSSLGEGWTRFAAAAIVAAAARFVAIRPRGGPMGTTALLFAGLMAIGEIHVSGYVVFVALFLTASLGTVATSEDTSLATATSARRLAIGGAMLLIGAAVAAGAVVGVRGAYAWMVNRAHPSAFVWQPRVGFADRMDLGALNGLLDSDVVVLRVRGARVDYLRGAVMDVYVAGRWLRSRDAEQQAEGSYDDDRWSGDAVEISAVSERTDRFFLPLDAHVLATWPGAVLVDGVGVVRRAAKHGVNVAHLARGDATPASPPPRASDLQLPRAIRSRLVALAAEWTRGVSEPMDQLDAIERRLRTEYHYARTFPRAGGADPALDFLFESKRGHCEYFATAMALVARAAGIPARAVMGYRVGEQSSLTYYVVRERNAHAWVEAWVSGRGWMTRDPTPDTELPQNRQHMAGYAASIADALSVGYDDFTEWLRRLTVQQTGIAWAAGFGVLMWIVARGARRRSAAGGRRLADDETARPCLTALLSALKRTGHECPIHESLERFAARVPDRDAARLLERYAAFRYGSIGDEGALAEECRTYARVLRSAGVRSPPIRPV